MLTLAAVKYKQLKSLRLENADCLPNFRITNRTVVVANVSMLLS